MSKINQGKLPCAFNGKSLHVYATSPGLPLFHGYSLPEQCSFYACRKHYMQPSHFDLDRQVLFTTTLNYCRFFSLSVAFVPDIINYNIPPHRVKMGKYGKLAPQIVQRIFLKIFPLLPVFTLGYTDLFPLYSHLYGLFTILGQGMYILKS